MASMATSGVVSESAQKMPPRVEPAGAVLAEDLVPIDIAGLELRDGGVAAVGAAQRGAHAESALGEVQAVAHGAADAVEWHPA